MQPSDEPLHRTTLNLYLSDAEWLKKRYGQGWSERVRLLVREYVNAKQEQQND